MKRGTLDQFIECSSDFQKGEMKNEFMARISSTPELRGI